MQNLNLLSSFTLPGLSFFDQKSEAQKIYSQAMKHPDVASWTEAITNYNSYSIRSWTPQYSVDLQEKIRREWNSLQI